jgi:hypothetical protein
MERVASGASGCRMSGNYGDVVLLRKWRGRGAARTVQTGRCVKGLHLCVTPFRAGCFG